MNTVVNTNVSALNSHRAITSVGGRQARSSERLSTGMRINRAADDAAGLAISEKMRSQIRGLDQAARNSQDGISLVQTAEGALEEVHSILQRARELTNQAANDTNNGGLATAGGDRAQIATEIENLMQEIGRISTTTQFNGRNILEGATVGIQAGANANQRLDITIGDMSLSGLSLDTFAATFRTNAENTDVAAGGTALSGQLTTLDTAINNVSTQRANLGAVQNRLEHTINNLNVASENLSAANSRIRDTDMAKEMMNFTQANVLQQAAMSMLAQANQAPQNILQLVG